MLLFKKAETYKKLEPMPVEDAGEREEKQRDEPSQLSSLWGDAGITQENSFFVRSKCGMLKAERTGGLGPFGSVPAPQAGVHPRSGHTRQLSV